MGGLRPTPSPLGLGVFGRAPPLSCPPLRTRRTIRDEPGELQGPAQHARAERYISEKHRAGPEVPEPTMKQTPAWRDQLVSEKTAVSLAK